MILMIVIYFLCIMETTLTIAWKIAIQPAKQSAIDSDMFNRRCKMAHDISSHAQLLWASPIHAGICEVYVISIIVKLKLPQTISIP